MEQTIAIIRAHGFDAEIRDEQVWGLMPWTRRSDDNTVESGATWELVENVWHWLGY